MCLHSFLQGIFRSCNILWRESILHFAIGKRPAGMWQPDERKFDVISNCWNLPIKVTPVTEGPSSWVINHSENY